MCAFSLVRVSCAVLLLSASVAFAVCGDNHIDGTEACDGTDLNGQTCADVTGGFAQSGTLACKPDCTLDTTDCRRAFIASLIPANGGGRQNHCHVEFGSVGTTAAKGNPKKRICSEGDPTCDVDQEFNNACTFRIQVCLDVPDPRFTSCQPARIVKLDVLAPSTGSDPGRGVASAILAAAKQAAPDQAHISGSGVSFGPPVTEFSCGSSTFKVPLKGTAGHARPGVIKVRARTSDNSGRVRSVAALTFACNP